MSDDAPRTSDNGLNAITDVEIKMEIGNEEKKSERKENLRHQSINQEVRGAPRHEANSPISLSGIGGALPNLDDICSVCHDPLNDGQPVFACPCRHVLHVDCMNAHMLQQLQDRREPSCPLCRAPILQSSAPAPQQVDPAPERAPGEVGPMQVDDTLCLYCHHDEDERAHVHGDFLELFTFSCGCRAHVGCLNKQLNATEARLGVQHCPQCAEDVPRNDNINLTARVTKYRLQNLSTIIPEAKGQLSELPPEEVQDHSSIVVPLEVLRERYIELKRRYKRLRYRVPAQSYLTTRMRDFDRETNLSDIAPGTTRHRLHQLDKAYKEYLDAAFIHGQVAVTMQAEEDEDNNDEEFEAQVSQSMHLKGVRNPKKRYRGH